MLFMYMYVCIYIYYIMRIYIYIYIYIYCKKQSLDMANAMRSVGVSSSELSLQDECWGLQYFDAELVI